MTKNLYQVIDTQTKKVFESGFKNRQEAKVIRDKQNEEHKIKRDGDSKPRFVVSRGSDHPHGETDGVTYHNMKKAGRRNKK